MVLKYPKTGLKKRLHVHLGTTYSKELELKRLKSSGYKVLVIDDLGFPPDDDLVFDYVLTTFDDPDRIVSFFVETCQKHRIEPGYFFTLAEGSVEFLNLVCKIYGQDPISLLENNLIRNKYEVRKRMSGHIAEPDIVLKVASEQDIPTLKDKDFPVVVKPVDSMASRGVKLVNTNEELRQACKGVFLGETIFNKNGKIINLNKIYGLSRQALIESVILGQEYSAEVLVRKGQIKFYALTKKMTSGPPFFYETGHLISADDLSDLKIEIESFLEKIVSENQYFTTILHVEFIVRADKKICLVEVNSRLAGGNISQLVFDSTGIDLIDHFLRILDNTEQHEQNINTQLPVNTYNGIFFISSEKKGILRIKTNSIQGRKIYWFKRNWEFVDQLETEKACRLGYVFFRTKSFQTALTELRSLEAGAKTVFDICKVKTNPLSVMFKSKAKNITLLSFFVLQVLVMSAVGVYQWLDRKQQIVFVGSVLAKTLTPYIISKEIVPIRQKISDFQGNNWFDKIVVTNDEYKLIHSQHSSGLPTEYYYQVADVDSYTYKFPIQSNGFTYGYVLMEPLWLNLYTPIFITLLIVTISLMLLYHLFLKVYLPRLMNQLESHIYSLKQYYETLALTLNVSEESVNKLPFDLDDLRDQLNRLQSPFSELLVLKESTRAMLDTIERMQQQTQRYLKKSNYFEHSAHLIHAIKEGLRNIQHYTIPICSKNTKEKVYAKAQVQTIVDNLLRLSTKHLKQFESALKDDFIATTEVSGTNHYSELNHLFHLLHQELSLDSKNTKVNLVISKKSQFTWIYCDPDYLVSLLRGVYRNSMSRLDSLPETSLNEIRTSISFEDDGCSVRIEDSGGGFLPRVLESSLKAPIKGNKNGSGTGIGLYSLKSYIKKLGGTLSLQNTQIGASVLIKIPCLPKPDHILSRLIIPESQGVWIVSQNPNVIQKIASDLKGNTHYTTHRVVSEFNELPDQVYSDGGCLLVIDASCFENVESWISALKTESTSLEFIVLIGPFHPLLRFEHLDKVRLLLIPSKQGVEATETIETEPNLDYMPAFPASYQAQRGENL
jgi:signal transduction histidine kinase